MGLACSSVDAKQGVESRGHLNLLAIWGFPMSETFIAMKLQGAVELRRSGTSHLVLVFFR